MPDSNEISPERRRYHELIESDFIPKLGDNSLVYDIGKSQVHDYSSTFQKHNHRLFSLDRELSKNPDFVVDLENDRSCSLIPPCDAALFNGVVEQCDDPFVLLKGLCTLLKPNVITLFGIVCLGYPEHTWDRFRFTSSGAKRYVERGGFDILHESIIVRGTQASYIYLIARKS